MLKMVSLWLHLYTGKQFWGKNKGNHKWFPEICKVRSRVAHFKPGLGSSPSVERAIVRKREEPPGCSCLSPAAPRVRRAEIPFCKAALERSLHRWVLVLGFLIKICWLKIEKPASSATYAAMPTPAESLSACPTAFTCFFRPSYARTMIFHNFWMI